MLATSRKLVALSLSGETGIHEGLLETNNGEFECSIRNNRSRISLIKQLNKVETPIRLES